MAIMEEAHPPLPLVLLEADEGAGVYAWLIEPMKVVPHKDGTCLVAYARHEDHDYLGEPNLYNVNARDVHEFLLWAVGVENPEEEGGEVYPQIVK
ncbi:hypothetical protein ASPCAL11748 [Aspergillus calidoustus]|jgi:hypothetical protein|uniref:Uncharacterized protein n=1 Tax=Aspergillus calidoustus TaxID=454130 RepID=A0A0U5GD97_ASPCI|nr:hypothetical protein ASPCAL11748 [Aspergillus calidoustus]